uniref:Uncharacterized protein n=1 Tax=Nelumbo nucifera TaxID=4432 RepID=A0A822YH95_NELNU|nr:TPA_asm: hypothetical protein HUJ06_009206 [Nelumbo nucifera]
MKKNYDRENLGLDSNNNLSMYGNFTKVTS